MCMWQIKFDLIWFDYCDEELLSVSGLWSLVCVLLMFQVFGVCVCVSGVSSLWCVCLRVCVLLGSSEENIATGSTALWETPWPLTSISYLPMLCGRARGTKRHKHMYTHARTHTHTGLSRATGQLSLTCVPRGALIFVVKGTQEMETETDFMDWSWRKPQPFLHQCWHTGGYYFLNPSLSLSRSLVLSPSLSHPRSFSLSLSLSRLSGV